MKVRGCMFKLTLGLAAMILFGFIPQVFANEDNSISTSDIIALVEQLDEEGQFANEGAFRAVKMHLTAVHHFEQQEETDKVIQHMNNFKMLVERQLDNEMITDQAHDALLDKTVDFIAELTAIPIVLDGQSNAVVIVPEDPNHTEIFGWKQYGTNPAEHIEVVNSKSYSGHHSLRINDTNATAYGLLSNRVGVTEGEEFTARAMVYRESGNYPSIQVRIYDAKGDAIGNYNKAVSTAGEWTEVSLATDPMPAEAVTIGIYIHSDSSGIRDFYVDDVELKKVGHEENLLSNPGFERNPNTNADTFIQYVQKSTGVLLPVVTSEPPNHDGVNIYVGHSPAEAADQHQGLLEELNEHGFIIDVKDNHITIRGTTDRATQFGVYDFLERYVGVRWLMPGPDGEHVPQQDSIYIPQKLVQEEPATISRHFFGMAGSANQEWYKYNRFHHNIQFHHNMNVLFDPEVFADHPEYYADGEVPTHEYSWQPCFNDTTAQAAIDRIIEYFDNNPDASSYSLGINDGTNYCEDPGHPDYPDETNSVGKLNRSDLYYRWVNKIAEGVTEVHPDKYFGLLAYREMYDPPKNEDGTPYKLHPNVVPYITDDRMTWIDPPIGEAGMTHTENWQQSAENLGFYEYLYGSQYNLPRIYLDKMAENYQYAHGHGVIGHVAELYPSWGEGPKPWVSAKLQWNPEQNVQDLIDEWYELAVGEEAAPYLAQYYEYWEQFWTTRIFESEWYDKWVNGPSRSNYLNFFEPLYMKEVTKADVTTTRQLLEQVVAHAGTEAEQTRAELLLRSFEFYEASALSYPQSDAVQVPADEQAALELLQDIKISLEMADKRVALMVEFEGHPVLDLHGRPRGAWNGVQRYMFAALQSYVETEPEGGAVGEQVDQFLAELPDYLRDQFLEDVPDIPNLSANAVKTSASKEEILNSWDFSQGPWADAQPFNEFLVMNTTNIPPAETMVHLLWDDENLYVGYENFDNNLDAMTVSDDAPNGWWRSNGDDSVETYITDDPDEAFLGFFTNPKAVSFSRYQSGLEPVDWESAAQIGEDSWKTIQAIPFSSIDVDPSQSDTLMGFFFRNYHGHTAFLGWGGGNPWNPDSFRPVHLIE